KNIIKYDEYLGKELTIEDITSKKIELDQKDVLIKEVHHRVKSNLQIILSLLNIDLHYHPNEPMIVLNDTRVRLNYMSNLHEYIYKQSEFTEVNIKEYLPQVAESLFKMYDNDITVHENLKDTVISMDLAIPLGLILTEVINNTIQYGFPNGESGEFILESQEDNGDCVIIMGNNGVDLPSDFDMDKSNTLGLTIIKSLTQELEGSFKMVSDNGVKVIIKFPIN
ncbi:MAG: sensor histidine kinase, partial [Methanobacteriaceae archaeon]|nr:sensor histidine kinase [Methanobacteriaceae archaeon]